MNQRDAQGAFVAAGFDGASWEAVEPLMVALRDREVGSAAAFERWLLDRSEFDAACAEARANLYIRMTCATDDEGASSAYTRYVEGVMPRMRPLAFELDRKQAALHETFPLDRRRYEVLSRDTRAEVELYREENVPLLTELEKLSQKYQTIIGAMTVTYRGVERTLPQMAPFGQDTDRAVREEAWRLVAARRGADAEAIEAVYEEQLSVRERVARNAGFADFRAYAFRSMRRFDYTPRDCEAFHEGVAEHVVPLVRKWHERRRASLGVATLRPWDLGVDEKGREALRPFKNGNELVDKTRLVFASMGSGLDVMFASLGDNGTPGANLDLDSRKGKAPGGYQYMRPRSRKPFIFMNAAGLHRDVETMVHEAGHAFHSMLCADEPLVAYRESPTEFAEVASMSMELLSMPWWRHYYPDREDAGRAVREHLEGSVGLLPWIAQMDAFQHWIYTHPGHSRAERRATWLALDEKFGGALDWSGLEEARARQWHRQLHLFVHPFYFIEYGIALIGAFGLWLTGLDRGWGHALELYKRALSLGGSRPLPELFAAAGLPFDFGGAAVSRAVRAVDRELAKLG